MGQGRTEGGGAAAGAPVEENAIEIRELNRMEVGELVKMAGKLKLNGAGKLPRRELLFKVIQAHAGIVLRMTQDTRPAAVWLRVG